jgi:hypothetical protein
VAESGRIFAARSLAFLQLPQSAFEIARIDRPEKGFDHLGERDPLRGCDGARASALLATFIAPRILVVLRIGGRSIPSPLWCF